MDLRHTEASRLDRQLSLVCDWRATNVVRSEIPELIGPAWGYVADSRYDSFCYAMIEAMLAGCWLFCGKHLVYDERPCIRFESAEDAIEKISATLDDKGMEINHEARQYVIDNYSLQVFRRQLTDIMGRNYGL